MQSRKCQFCTIFVFTSTCAACREAAAFGEHFVLYDLVVEVDSVVVEHRDELEHALTLCWVRREVRLPSRAGSEVTRASSLQTQGVFHFIKAREIFHAIQFTHVIVS